MPRYDYTTLDNVKRIMRSVSGDPSVQKKIRFSDARSLPKKHSTNAGTGMLLDFTVAGSYVGIERWKITFTSTTAFTLYRGEDELATDGTGAIGSSFISGSKIITILPANWTGTMVSGDSFKFQTESNMSNADAEEFLSDAEDIVNSMLEEYMGSTNVPITGTIPTKVATGTAYMAAFLIFSTIYSSTDQPSVPEFVNRWYRIGANLVAAYIETIPARLMRHAMHVPRFATREPLFDKVGIPAVEGVGLAMGDDHGEVEATDISYDTFFNTEEGGN